MPVPTVHLKLRVKLPDGSRAYVEPVYSANQKLKPLYGVVDGKHRHHPEGVYHLRYAKGGKRIWEPVGKDPQVAMTAQLRVENGFQAVALGLSVPQAAIAEAAVAEAAGPETKKTDLAEASAEYLRDIASARSKSTFNAYACTLQVFATICPKRYLEDINRRDILNYHDHLRASGNAPRTVANRSNFLKIFFRHEEIAWPLKKTDRVTYTEKAISAYDQADISKFLEFANQEESELIQFFLLTGARDQEVAFATWRDVSFSAKTFSVSEKLDLGFKPKDKEEGDIPIPDCLVDLLRARREKHPHTRLVFPFADGKPDRHFLRTVKKLALRAGMNCGCCYNKAGQCCATKPVCDRIGLHRFRKTFATMHHQAGVPVDTIRRWLRHSGLDVTQAYLAGSDDKSPRTREQVNNTFAFLTKVA